MLNKNDIKVIAFDADDTLWINETYFREKEELFTEVMSTYLSSPDQIMEELFKTEMQNLSNFGYGAKGFTLSMIETAIKVSSSKITPDDILKIIDLGKSLLTIPIDLLDDVVKVLSSLQNKYKLVVATKGDLLDQERKLVKSGLTKYFHHIEIMSEKKDKNYQKLLNRLEISPKEFLMIGNSLKSDILPVVNIGGDAIHIPFHTTWVHESINEESIKHLNYLKVNKIIDVLKYL